MRRPPLSGQSVRQLTGFLFVLFALSSATALAATLPSGFTETLVANGLTAPTAMQFAPDGRLFVAQQGGQLRVIKNGILLPNPFVTLTVDSTGERGLLGVAFDPNFGATPFVYVYYTATTTPRHNRISRFLASGDVATGSEQVLFDLDDLSGATNHNGGAINFGPDGKLYAAVGENANGANAQSMSTVLGKMLRLNSDGTIPMDNPFVATTAGKNQAIWALGLRNPFTFAFHQFSGQMFINDVGQSTWEEINDGLAGANYGWPQFEGSVSEPGSTSNPRHAYSSAGSDNDGACAITGGAFYAPVTAQFPSDYVNDYFFADYCGNWIRKLDPALGNSVTTFATGISNPVDLKVGDDGSLYYLARGAGAVYRVTYGPPPPPGALSGSGTSASTDVNLTAEGETDWVHWGDANLNRKSGGGAQISTYTLIGGGTVLSYTNDTRTMGWTDGAPMATSAGNRNGVYVAGVGRGFMLQAPADPTERTLRVHVAGYNSSGRLTAHLSDGSAADFVDTTALGSGLYDRNYTLTYASGLAGQTLQVSWVVAAGSGNVAVNGAALGTAGPPPPPGALSGSGTSASTDVNLTTEGGTDWVHWGDANLNRKSGGGAQISTYTLIGGGTVLSYSNDTRTMGWTDGAPMATSAGNRNGVYVAGVGRGFMLQAPADPTERTLRVHVAGYNSSGRLTAHLSDGSAADFVDTTALGSGLYDRNYTLTYASGLAGQTLQVSWVVAAGSGNVAVNGAALGTAGPPPPPGALSGSGTSASTDVNLTTEGGTDWVHWGDANLNRKSGGGAQISTYTLIGGGTVLSYSNDTRTMGWTDGAPMATSAGNRNGVYVAGVGRGFMLQAPADPTERTLRVHVAGYNSSGRLTAHLSDGSAADFVDTTALGSGLYDRNYTLTYSAGLAGQTLQVSWVVAAGSGNVAVSAAALAAPPP